MKKIFQKILTIVLSLVIICASVSVGASAFAIEKCSVEELDGYYAENYLTNNKMDIAFFELKNRADSGEDKYVYTTDGKTYDFVDFSVFVPECDAYQLADYSTDGENFVFFFCCYNKEAAFDDEADGYVDNYEVCDNYFIVTKDFQTFTQHRVEVETQETVCEGDYSDFRIFGLLKFLDDEWLFANGDYVITGTTENEKLGKGVYYTTKDFEEWEIHYTQEDVVWSEEEKEFMYFDSYGSVSVINVNSPEDCYLLIDGEVYGPVFAEEENGEEGVFDVLCIDNKTKAVLREDTIKTSEDEFCRLTIVDLESGEETVIYEGEKSFEILKGYFNNILYLIFVDHENEYCKMYEVNDKFEFIPVDTPFMTDESLVTFYPAGTYCFECLAEKIRIYDKRFSDFITVDFSETLLTLREEMKAFVLNGKLFILDTSPDGGKAYVYETRADLIKSGDVNADGTVNSTDALLVLQHSTGLVELNEKAILKADVDKSNSVTSSDALLILQYATGIIPRI